MYTITMRGTKNAESYYHGVATLDNTVPEIDTGTGYYIPPGSKNTARWIISVGIKRFPEAALLYRLSSYVELSMHSVESAGGFCSNPYNTVIFVEIFIQKISFVIILLARRRQFEPSFVQIGAVGLGLEYGSENLPVAPG